MGLNTLALAGAPAMPEGSSRIGGVISGNCVGGRFGELMLEKDTCSGIRDSRPEVTGMGAASQGVEAKGTSDGDESAAKLAMPGSAPIRGKGWKADSVSKPRKSEYTLYGS